MGKRYAGPVIGEPDSYRWGDPGWDCSSFVSAAYAEVGVKLPAFTDAIATVTVEVPQWDALPGDIVLYRYYDEHQPNVRYPHVALWYGPGEMLDAQWKIGVGVHPLLPFPYEVRRPS